MKLNKTLNLFVCGLCYKICQSTGLYDGSVIGLSLKVDHGRKMLKFIDTHNLSDLMLATNPNKSK